MHEPSSRSSLPKTPDVPQSELPADRGGFELPQASILGISAGSGVTDWTMACAVLATPPRMSLRASGSSDNLASATVDRKDGLE